MRTIVFIVGTGPSSINGTLKLAKTLKTHGNKVIFLGIKQVEQRIRQNDLEFISIFDEWFPGIVELFDSTSLSIGLEKLRVQQQITRQYNNFIDAIYTGLDEQFFRLIADLSPDLLIVVHAGEPMVIPALLAYATGINTIYFREMLGQSQHPTIPPMWSNLIPSDSITSRLMIWLEWQKAKLWNTVLRRPLIWCGLTIDWHKRIKALAKKYNYPWKSVACDGLPAFTLKLPQLVACHECFEFPGVTSPDRYYIGASIDTDRAECEFPWDQVDDTKPIIYCALGSLILTRKNEYKRFYQVVLDIAKEHQEWQWIVGIGNTLKITDFGTLPGNAVVVNQVPQLSVLRRAKLMITHGGFNTVKECIFFGVPMVVFPLSGYDWTGDAARVAYHGLGVRGSWKKLNPNHMEKLILLVANNPFYRLQVKLMQKKFIEHEKMNIGLTLINALLTQNTGPTNGHKKPMQATPLLEDSRTGT